MMDMRKIQYFIVIAETLNFSKAAERCHISHQALSKQIKVLEDEVGAALFERTTTAVHLTEAGRRMYEIFRPIVTSMAAGCEAMERFVQYKKSVLKVGYFSGLSFGRVISPIIDAVQKLLPEVAVDITAVDMESVREQLLHDEIDLAICPMPNEEDWKNAKTIPVFYEQEKILISAKHPWAKKDVISVDDIRDGDMFVYSNRPSEGGHSFLSRMEVHKRIPVKNVDTYMARIEEGKGFGIVSEYYSRREGHYLLKELPEEYQMEIPIGCAFKRLHPVAAELEKLEKMRLKVKEEGIYHI